MALPNPNMMYQQQVYTTPPDKLLLMLYDGAIRFCRQAVAAIEDKKIQEAHESIVKAQRIIEEFMVTLDMQIEVAKSIYSLYDYMYRRLIEANIHKDPAILQEVLGFLIELRQVWAQAAVIARSEKAIRVSGM